VTPIGTFLYVALIATSFVMCKRVPRWDKEVIFIDDLGHARYGYKLHYLVAFAALALALSGHLVLSRFDVYTMWLLKTKDEAATAGWFCFTTVGGFLLKPSPTVAGHMLKPSQTRPVRIACGLASGFGLGTLIVRYLPFVL
jgi:hypothetical protein